MGKLPQPGDLDSKPARAGIAGLADALINAHRATVVGARRQAKIAGQFAAIVEVTIEYFPQPRCAGEPPKNGYCPSASRSAAHKRPARPLVPFQVEPIGPRRLSPTKPHT